MEIELNISQPGILFLNFFYFKRSKGSCSFGSRAEFVTTSEDWGLNGAEFVTTGVDWGLNGTEFDTTVEDWGLNEAEFITSRVDWGINGAEVVTAGEDWGLNGAEFVTSDDWGFGLFGFFAVSFLAFILRFWNQIFTCLSDNPKSVAKDARLGLHK